MIPNMNLYKNSIIHAKMLMTKTVVYPFYLFLYPKSAQPNIYGIKENTIKPKQTLIYFRLKFDQDFIAATQAPNQKRQSRTKQQTLFETDESLFQFFLSFVLSFQEPQVAICITQDIINIIIKTIEILLCLIKLTRLLFINFSSSYFWSLKSSPYQFWLVLFLSKSNRVFYTGTPYTIQCEFTYSPLIGNTKGYQLLFNFIQVTSIDGYLASGNLFQFEVLQIQVQILTRGIFIPLMVDEDYQKCYFFRLCIFFQYFCIFLSNFLTCQWQL
ncbi:transmembrane protein, putative (macronuclear) [Tetrahymena thermophila SB210]|uniref:Transmembrane protein, putative n=1 Tax=Tetrahymena thermophila (strain SB210) TaxID=312017 RepID=W7XEP9_TETTS|nr:transmembrane protein, putative [Tetrahymena thermophila SB210]EWS72371.1 transmembrane protein, putative [Tetrahymena thermophila SB210]|eukprot:XP_012655093.1 transmembrane protein, putative [Tetrahymena thermophila SB210]